MSEKLEPIRETVVIDRPVESLWRTMTERAPEWLGCMRYVCEVGAVFFMQQDRAKASADDVSGATQCEILELEAPNLFRFSWFVPNTPPTFVTFRLEAINGASTRVLFEHDGWDKFPADQIKPIRDMMDGGWKSFVLPNLKRVAEG